MIRKLSAGAPVGSPFYKAVKVSLMNALAKGEWKAGDALPSERVLASRFDVAIGTLRKAVGELVREHILVRQQGRGTFVAAHDRDRTMFYFFHIVRHDGTKEYPTVELLSFRRALADAQTAAKLAIPKGAAVFEIRNLLRLDGRPLLLDQIVIARSLFPGLTKKIFRDRPNTIYHLYQSAFGISVVRSVERLRATTADAATAALLAVQPGSPLLEIRRVAMTYADAPVEFRRSLVNTDRHEYFSDLGANDALAGAAQPAARLSHSISA